MKLHTLYFGTSKKRMRPIMTDSYKKCENYMVARENVIGFHKIEEENDVNATVWRQKSATVGGNRCERTQIVGKGPAGYISKRGFQQHT